MSKKLKKAFEDVKTLNNMFSSVQELATAFNDVAQVEEAVISAQKTKASILEEIEKVKAEKEVVVSEITALKDEKKAIQQKNKSIFSEADEKAKKIMDNVVAERAYVLREIEEMKALLEKLQGEHTAKVQEFEKQILDKQIELEDFQAKLESTKAALRNLVV